jgi:protein required for attachment to host cells
MTQLILVCDAGDARFFQASDGEALRILRVMHNPRGRASDRELLSDAPGRVCKPGGACTLSAMDPRTSAHEVEAERFARRLAAALQGALDRGEYDSLAVFAPPHFLGVLRSSIGPQVRKRLSSAVAKDFAHVDQRVLKARLKRMLLPGA